MKNICKFINGLNGHDFKLEQPMHQNLSYCRIFFELPDVNKMDTDITNELHLLNAVVGNCNILQHNTKWSQLQ